MNELISLLVGIVLLGLGFPIGNLLRNYTKEEQKIGWFWFKVLVYIGLIGGFFGLILSKDWIMFSFFFIAIVSSRSLVIKK